MPWREKNKNKNTREKKNKKRTKKMRIANSASHESTARSVKADVVAKHVGKQAISILNRRFLTSQFQADDFKQSKKKKKCHFPPLSIIITQKLWLSPYP